MGTRYQYGGFAASLIRIAFGIGAVYVGVSGRHEVRMAVALLLAGVGFGVLTFNLLPATKREGTRAQADGTAVTPA